MSSLLKFIGMHDFDYDSALCTKLTVEQADAIFFVEAGKNAREAKALCAQCPVRRDCLDRSLMFPQMDGVWAGKTTRERSELKQKFGVPRAAPRKARLDA